MTILVIMPHLVQRTLTFDYGRLSPCQPVKYHYSYDNIGYYASPGLRNTVIWLWKTVVMSPCHELCFSHFQTDSQVCVWKKLHEAMDLACHSWVFLQEDGNSKNSVGLVEMEFARTSMEIELIVIYIFV